MADQRPTLRRQGSLADFAGHMTQGASMSAVSEVRALFRQCDKDGDGKLTKDELGAVMKELQIQHTKAELDTMFKQLDTDGSGAITLDEFLTGIKYMEKSRRMLNRVGPLKQKNSVADFVKSLEDQQVQQIRELFSLMDANSDGVVTKQELYNVMKQMGLEPTKEEVIALFNELDTDKNGKIEFPEFVAGMRWLRAGGLINGQVQEPTTRERSASKETKGERRPRTPSTSEGSAEDQHLIKDLQERNQQLANCLKEVITRGMGIAEKHYKAKEYHETRLVLDTLDMATFIDMEPLIGQVTTPKQKEHYTKMQRRLSTL